MMTNLAITFGAVVAVINLFMFWSLCNDVRALRRIAENEHQWFTDKGDRDKGDRP